MSYSYSSTGKVSYVHTYIQPRTSYSGRYSSYSPAEPPTSEPVNKHSLYANSQENVESGHFVSFSSLQAQTSVPDLATVEQTADHKHVAGVVIERAAEPTDTIYTNKNGIHSNHVVSGHQHILRVGMPGSRVDAWVVDEHENAFEGVYEKTINGAIVGHVVIKNIDAEHFSIETFGTNDNLVDEVADLRAKLEALTTST